MGKRKQNGYHGKNTGLSETAGRGQGSGDSRTEIKANLHYKDTIFRMLFREKKHLLALYSAITGKDSTDYEKLEIVTLESAVYMGMKNDLAFLVDFGLYLFEHQSTVNRNMPLRFLQYVSAEYERLTATESLFVGRQVRIPAPHFLVFYNGRQPYPEETELKLSDAYGMKEGEPELELRVRVININDGFNENLKRQCLVLGEYMKYVGKVRRYIREMPPGEAVDRAVDECIREDILREFLLKNKAEVKHMSIFEYDEEAVRRAIREDAYEQGLEEGKIRGEKKGEKKGFLSGRREDILYFLEEMGAVPEKLRSEIMEETDIETLKRWLRLAGRAESMEAFIKGREAVLTED